MSAVKTVSIVTGGTVAVGLGGYVLIQLDRSNKLSQEVSRLQDQAKALKSSYASHDAEIKTKEQTVEKLSAQVETELEGLKQLEGQMSKARKELERVEAMFYKKQDTVSALTKERNDLKLSILNLRTLVSKDQEALATLSSDLTEQQRKVHDARQLINPLNHPDVKKLLGRA